MICIILRRGQMARAQNEVTNTSATCFAVVGPGGFSLFPGFSPGTKFPGRRQETCQGGHAASRHCLSATKCWSRGRFPEMSAQDGGPMARRTANGEVGEKGPEEALPTHTLQARRSKKCTGVPVTRTRVCWRKLDRLVEIGPSCRSAKSQESTRRSRTDKYH